jgi:hypothetical protein
VRLISPMTMQLIEFIPKANQLVMTIEKEDRFLMIDHDFNFNINRAYNDSRLYDYLV